jgi:hypothetical protein
VREHDASLLKMMQQTLKRAKWDVEAAQERLKHLSEMVRELKRKISAALSIVACSVDGVTYEVTFYDRDADVIHRLDQRMRNGKVQIVRRRLENHHTTEQLRDRIIRTAQHNL